MKNSPNRDLTLNFALTEYPELKMQIDGIIFNWHVALNCRNVAPA